MQLIRRRGVLLDAIFSSHDVKFELRCAHRNQIPGRIFASVPGFASPRACLGCESCIVARGALLLQMDGSSRLAKSTLLYVGWLTA